MKTSPLKLAMVDWTKKVRQLSKDQWLRIDQEKSNPPTNEERIRSCFHLGVMVACDEILHQFEKRSIIYVYQWVFRRLKSYEPEMEGYLKALYVSGKTQEWKQKLTEKAEHELYENFIKAFEEEEKK